MSQIGTLVTGAGVQTVISGQAQCEAALLLGDVDTAMPLSGLQVEVDGQSTINIQGSQPLVSAFSKFIQQIAGTVVGLLIKVSTGKIRRTTTYRFTNNGATTPAIYAFSDSDNGVAVLAASKGINAQSYDIFRNFSALMITPSANVGTVDITFKDGNKNTYRVEELDALFSVNNQTEANGRLDAVVTTIDNRQGSIDSVQVNATTAVTVLVIKFPDDQFKALKAKVNG